MRLSGLDDSAKKEDVAAAVAKVGGCAVDSVKVGDIVRPPGREGTVWLRCPVAAAKTVAAGRLLVNWVSVSTKILEERLLRCYRCLEVGHVGPKCLCAEDRSALCFPCECCTPTHYNSQPVAFWNGWFRSSSPKEKRGVRLSWHPVQRCPLKKRRRSRL